MTLQERLTLTGFRAAWLVCAKLPEPVVLGFFTFIADMAWLSRGNGVKRLQFNLSRVLDKEPISITVKVMSKEVMRSYFRYWAQLFRFSAYSKDEILKRARMENREILDTVLAQGRGAVIVLPHSGNWDWAAAWVAMKFHGVTTVAERLKPEELFDLFVSLRVGYGLEVLPHRGGDKPPTQVLGQRLREGKIVALVSDRDFTRRGVETIFFNHATTFPTGALRLSLEHGAPIVTAGAWSEGSNVVMTLYSVIEPNEGTQETRAAAIAQAFEQHISQHPQNWHMLQQIWPDHPREWAGAPR